MRLRAGTASAAADQVLIAKSMRPVGGKDAGAKRGRILMAFPHRLLLDVLPDLLEPEFAVIGAVQDGNKLLQLTERLQPDLILADAGLPGPTPRFIIQCLRERAPTARIIYLMAEMDQETAAESSPAEASACLSRNCSTTELRQALRSVLKGRCDIPSATTSEHAVQAIEVRHRLARLSAREVQVLRHLIGGLTMKLVARQLGITPRTVAFHKYRAMNLLGLHGNKELMEFALRYGLITTVKD